MKNSRHLGIYLISLSLTLITLGGCGSSGGEKPAPKGAATTTPSTPEAPPGAPVTNDPPKAAPAKLKDLKLEFAKGWEAKYSDVLQEWTVSKEAPPDYPDVYIQSFLTIREPKSLEDYVERIKKDVDMRGMGYIYAEVTEKGMLPDGYYVVGKVRLSTDKEAKNTAFSIVRDLGGQKLCFMCFKISDPAQRKEAMDWCKAAKF
jgi:hypothetical protein